MEILNQPIVQNTVQQVAKNTVTNALKLGVVAGAAIFTTNVFKTVSKQSIEQAQQDYYLIRNAISNR